MKKRQKQKKKLKNKKPYTHTLIPHLLPSPSPITDGSQRREKSLMYKKTKNPNSSFFPILSNFKTSFNVPLFLHARREERIPKSTWKNLVCSSKSIYLPKIQT